MPGGTPENHGSNLVATVAAPAEGRATSFTYRDNIGMISDAFVIRFHGQLYAYKNQCRHQPLTLDYGDGDVFTEDAGLLICRNHGALFQPATGLCIDGPCLGARLFSLPCTENQSGQVVVSAPVELPDLE